MRATIDRLRARGVAPQLFSKLRVKPLAQEDFFPLTPFEALPEVRQAIASRVASGV